MKLYNFTWFDKRSLTLSYALPYVPKVLLQLSHTFPFLFPFRFPLLPRDTTRQNRSGHPGLP